jgi:hypothetical protein
MIYPFYDDFFSQFNEQFSQHKTILLSVFINIKNIVEISNFRIRF